MCFSAEASFGAGIALSVIGVASIRSCREPSQIPFAAIPLLFAMQQISEGFVWLSFSQATFEPVRNLCTHLFLFFAHVVWPFWVPFSVMKMEKNAKKKIQEKILLFFGCLVSVSLGYCLFSFRVAAEAVEMHILYVLDYPQDFRVVVGILYSLATIVPTFFSPIKRMWMLGLSIFVSYVIAHIFYNDYFVSVWCFFASIISLAVLAVIYYAKNSPEKSLENQTEKSFS